MVLQFAVKDIGQLTDLGPRLSDPRACRYSADITTAPTSDAGLREHRATGQPGTSLRRRRGGQTSRRHARDELVEDLDHLGTRPRAVCRLRDVQGGLVAGPHEYVRERPGPRYAD